VPVEIPFDEAWARFMSPKGLLAEGTIEQTGEGDAYAFTTALGESFEGRILVHRPPTDFSGTVENMDGAIFRLGLEAYSGKRECFMWLHSWHIGETEARERQGRWTEFVRSLLAP
jgi:hypothetical protein